MSTALQIRRGTTLENSAFTGLQSELTVDTDTNQLILHDGTTQGGYILKITTPGSDIYIGDTIAGAGLHKVAIGSGSSAGGYSVSMGKLSSAKVRSVAIGIGTNSGNWSVAIGENSKAYKQATALGSGSNAAGFYCVSIGYNAKNNGTGYASEYSVVVGAKASTSSKRGVSIGARAGCGLQSTALGYSAIANSNSVAIGESSSSLDQSLAIGNLSSAKVRSVAVGYQSTAYNSSIAIGPNSATFYNYCVAIGHAAKAGNLAGSGNYAVAVGYNTNARDVGSVSLGTYASSYWHSIAIGYSAKSQSQGVAVGTRTTCGASSVVIGSRCTGSGTSSVVIGDNCVSSGHDSIAIGRVNNGVNRTAMLSAGICIQSADTTFQSELDHAGVEVVYTTKELDFTTTIPTGWDYGDLNIPTGTVFMLTDYGVICTQSAGTVSVQPTVEVHTSLDGTTYTPIEAGVLTTALTTARGFQSTRTITPNVGTSFLRGVITSAGTSTGIFKGRFYFKGVLLEM